MAAKAKFAPTGVYKRTVFKPDGSGGKLLLFRRTRIQVYLNYPDRMPWATGKTADAPHWRSNRGCEHFEIGRALERVERHRLQRETAQRDGTTYGPHPQLDGLERFVELFEPRHLALLRDYPRESWSFYTALRRCKGLMELSEGGDRSLGRAGNEALAFALSQAWTLLPLAVTQPLRTLRRLLGGRRREAAERLGFASHGNLSALRVMARIAKRSLCVDTLISLQCALHSRDRHSERLLAHTERLNKNALDLVARPLLAARVTPALMQEVGHRGWLNHHSSAAHTLRDTLELIEQRGGRAPSFRSRAQLQEVHDQEVARRVRVREVAMDVALPPPPVRERPGHIEYVSSSLAALEQEGRLMHNCVGGYARRVARGECYIYRVLVPERCTLSIRPDRFGRFQLDEVKGHCNQPAGPDTLVQLTRWLEDSQAQAVTPTPDYLLRLMQATGGEANNYLDDDIPF